MVPYGTKEAYHTPVLLDLPKNNTVPAPLGCKHRYHIFLLPTSGELVGIGFLGTD
jgi:hypothetical protein